MLADLLEKAFLSLIGLSVFCGALYTIYFRDAHYWRYLSKFYEAPGSGPLKPVTFNTPWPMAKGLPQNPTTAF